MQLRHTAAAVTGAAALAAAAPAVAQTPGMVPTVSKVKTTGIGKVKFGMTIAQAKQTAGVYVRRSRVGDCVYLDSGPPGTADGPTLRFHNGRFRQVSVGTNDYRTAKHLGVGSSVRKVRKRYPGVRRVTDIGGGYRLVFRPKRGGKGRLVFVIGGGKVVTLISGQAPWVDQQECV